MQKKLCRKQFGNFARSIRGGNWRRERQAAALAAAPTALPPPTANRSQSPKLRTHYRSSMLTWGVEGGGRCRASAGLPAERSPLLMVASERVETVASRACDGGAGAAPSGFTPRMLPAASCAERGQWMTLQLSLRPPPSPAPWQAPPPTVVRFARATGEDGAHACTFSSCGARRSRRRPRLLAGHLPGAAHHHAATGEQGGADGAREAARQAPTEGLPPIRVSAPAGAPAGHSSLAPHRVSAVAFPRLPLFFCLAGNV